MSPSGAIDYYNTLVRRDSNKRVPISIRNQAFKLPPLAPESPELLVDEDELIVVLSSTEVTAMVKLPSLTLTSNGLGFQTVSCPTSA